MNSKVLIALLAVVVLAVMFEVASAQYGYGGGRGGYGGGYGGGRGGGYGGGRGGGYYGGGRGGRGGGYYGGRGGYGGGYGGGRGGYGGGYGGRGGYYGGGYGGQGNSIYGLYGSSGSGGYYDDMDDDCGSSYGGGYSSYGGCGGGSYAASSAQPTTATQTARTASESGLDSLLSGSDAITAVSGASDSPDNWLSVMDQQQQQDQPWMLPNNDGPLTPFDLVTGGDSNSRPTLASSASTGSRTTSVASSSSSSGSSSSSTDKQRERNRLKPGNRQQLQAPQTVTSLFGGAQQQVPTPSVPSSTTTAAPEYVMINPLGRSPTDDQDE